MQARDAAQEGNGRKKVAAAAQRALTRNHNRTYTKAEGVQLRYVLGLRAALAAHLFAEVLGTGGRGWAASEERA